MQKANKNILLFFLLCSYISFSQSVALSSSQNPINFGTSATKNVSLSANISLQSVPSDSYPGTIKIYYKRNQASPAIIPTGGDGGNLLFFGGTFGLRDFNITLLEGQFDASGGFLYAEYETYSHIKYKSGNISIIKSTSPENPDPENPDPGNPNPGSCNWCYGQILPYGGIPVFPRLPENVNGAIYDWVEVTTQGYVPRTLPELSIPFTSTRTFKQRKRVGQTVSYIGEKKILVQGITNVDATTISNNVLTDVSINGNQVIINGNGATIGRTYVNNLGYVYQWQSKSILSENWGLIDNSENAAFYSSNPFISFQSIDIPITREYRRVIIRPIESMMVTGIASNVLRIYKFTVDNTINNTICCNRTYNSTGVISPIIGSSDSGFNYQWQVGYMNNYTNSIIWTDVVGAVLKDYTPERPSPYSLGPRGQGNNRYYRRIMINTSNYKVYESNIVILTYLTTSNRLSSAEETNKDQLASLEDNNISIFPNPATSVINIEFQDVSSYYIKVIDLTGIVILSKKPNTSSIHSLEIDISKLQKGVYNLVFEKGGNKIVKKIIKQ